MLLEAAQSAFAENGYLGTTVEHILQRSGIGRTSFYKHFPDKLAVASALFTAFMPALEDAYATIGDAPVVDLPTVAAWLDALIADYRRNAGIMTLIAEVMVAEPGFSATITTVQRAIMARLGQRFPAFAAGANAATPESAERTEAAIILSLIDGLCSSIALRGAELDPAAATRFVAAIVLPFLLRTHSAS